MIYWRGQSLCPGAVQFASRVGASTAHLFQFCSRTLTWNRWVTGLGVSRVEPGCQCPFLWGKSISSEYFRQKIWDLNSSPFFQPSLFSKPKGLPFSSWNSPHDSASIDLELHYLQNFYAPGILEKMWPSSSTTLQSRIPVSCLLWFWSALNNILHNLVGFSPARQGKVPARSWGGNWQWKYVIVLQRAHLTLQSNLKIRLLQLKEYTKLHDTLA